MFKKVSDLRIPRPFRRFLVRIILSDYRYIVDSGKFQTAGEGKANLNYFGEGGEYRIIPPVGDDRPDEFCELTGSYKYGQEWAAELSDVLLIGPQPVGISPEGKFVLETAEGRREILEHRVQELIREYGLLQLMRILKQPSHSTQRHIEGTVFPLVRHPTTMYYHWLTEYVPKLRALEYYEKKGNTSPTILVSRDPPKWVVDSISLAGYEFEECETWDGGSVRVETLLLTKHRSGNEITPDQLQWLRQRMRKNIKDSGTTRDASRIYISRSDASDRRVVNEKELMDRLSERGFERYLLSKLSVAEQVELFSEAEIVVAPHGAGLTNVLFADGVKIVELLPEDDIRDHYYRLANKLGFDYSCVLCNPVGKDLSADVDRIDDLVESLY